MSRIDERLTERLRSTTRPVGEHDVMSSLERRVRRHDIRRRVGTGVLSVAVLAGSIGGFLALRDAFEGDDVAIPAATATNGAVAYAHGRFGADQVFIAPLEGDTFAFDDAVQATAGEASVRDPAWSPDGHSLAFIETRTNGGGRIAVYDLATGTVRPLTQWRAGIRLSDLGAGWRTPRLRRLGTNRRRPWVVRPLDRRRARCDRDEDRR